MTGTEATDGSALVRTARIGGADVVAIAHAGWRVSALGRNEIWPVDRYSDDTVERFHVAVLVVDDRGRHQVEFSNRDRRVEDSHVPVLRDVCLGILRRYVDPVDVATADCEPILVPHPADDVDNLAARRMLVSADEALFGPLPNERASPMILFDPATQRRARVLEASQPWLKGDVGGTRFDAIVRGMDDLRPSADSFRLVRILDGNDVMTPSKPGWTGWTRGALDCAAAFNDDHVEIPFPDLQDTIALLSVLPQSWLPRDEREYRAAQVLSHATRRLWFLGYGEARTMFAGVSGGWEAFLLRLGHRIEDPDAFRSALQGVSDVVGHVGRELVDPAIPQRQRRLSMLGYDEAMLDIVARLMTTPDGGLGLLLEKSERWHEVHTRLPVLRTPSAAAWEPLSPPFERDGLVLSFLVDGAMLIDEGSVQRHCVASLHAACARGATHVASVRIADGSRLSTVEIRRTREGGQEIVQHRARSNAAPPETARRLVSAWMSEVETGRHPVLPTSDGVADADRLPCGGFPELVLPVSGTPSDWRGILRPSLTSLDWEDFVAEVRRIGREFPDELLRTW